MPTHGHGILSLLRRVTRAFFFESGQAASRPADTRQMGWIPQTLIPADALVPLATAAAVPLLLLAALMALTRWRGQSIATVMTLRTLVVLGAGFAALAAVAVIGIVQTGLSEIRARHDGGIH